MKKFARIASIIIVVALLLGIGAITVYAGGGSGGGAGKSGAADPKDGAIERPVELPPDSQDGADTPEETPEPTPEATPEATPEPTPEATPEPTPVATPTPTPPPAADSSEGRPNPETGDDSTSAWLIISALGLVVSASAVAIILKRRTGSA